MRNFQVFFASFLCVLFVSTQNLSAQLDRYLLLSADTLRFDIPCGEVECLDILLRNNFDAPIRIVSLTPAQTPFSLSTVPAFNTPVTIPGGESRTVQFCFAPVIPGLSGSQNNLVMTVDTGDGANLARDTVVLLGLSRSAAVDFDPPEINFGGIVLAKQTCQQVTVSNNGNQPISLAEILPLSPPYSVSPPITGTLAPGTSITIDICFEPTVEGLYPDTLRLANGACRLPAELVVNGAGMTLAPDIGPILQLSPSMLDFDTTRCGTTKCRDITIRNVGSSVTVITDPDQIIAPFSGTFPPTPLSLEPDSGFTVRICYTPPDAPRLDTQLVRFTADSRYSLTIATVFDRSGSMDFVFGTPPKSKISAAHSAGRVFLGSLIRDTLRGVVDTAAVYEFGGSGQFNRLAGYATDGTLLQGAVPSTTVSQPLGTCIYDALLRTIVELQQQNLPGRRVIVLLTDGVNTRCGGNENQVIAAANAAGIRIYTIGIGNLADVDPVTLGAMASQTRGRYFFAPDADSLVNVYRQISEDLSKSAAGYIVLRGEGAAPVLQMTPSVIDYDSVRVDSSRCVNVRLTNVGNAPYPGGPLEGIDPPFATATPIAPPLVPGESVDIEVCFGPEGLRIRRDTVRLPYISCAEDSLSAELVGVGYDSVVVEMRDIYTGRPGSIIDIPVYLLDPMPDLYEVDSLRVQIKFNKTMLAPTPDFVQVEETAAADMVGEVEAVRYDGDTAVFDLLFSDGRLRSDQPTSELARLRFLVLLGNAMETPVTAAAAEMADGNPKVGRRNPALFRIDSICYLPDRLLDASARYNGLIKSVASIDGKLVIRYEAMLEEGVDPLPARLALYDRVGRQVKLLDERIIDASGIFESISDSDGLSAGLYFIRLSIGQLSWTVSRVEYE